MAVQPIHEEVHQPRLTLVPTEEAEPVAVPAPEAPRPIVQRTWNFPTTETIAVLAAISAIIAVRLILLVGTVIGGALVWQAMATGSPVALGASVIYCAGVMIPLVWLTVQKG